MRAYVVLALFLLAGCTGPDGEPLTLDEAEEARSASQQASGPDGTLKSMAGTLDMAMEFDDTEMVIAMVFDVEIHQNDAFSMDLTMELQGESDASGSMEMRCTPSDLWFTMNFGGETQTFEAANTRGTCLDTTGAGLGSFLEAFEGMEGFESSGLGVAGLAPDTQLPYTTVRQSGSATIASYEGEISEQGFALTYAGEDTFRAGLLRASHVEMSAESFGMELTMDVAYGYGARTHA